MLGYGVNIIFIHGILINIKKKECGLLKTLLNWSKIIN